MPIDDIAQQADIANLYQAHHGWLYNWLRRRLGCSHNAADLAQDTYLRLLTSERMPGSGQARSYLMQIARGLVIDRHRRQLIEQAYLEALANQPEAVSASPEEQSLILETLVQIDAALSRLKPKIRETFLLSRFHGMKYSDIASRQGISLATVRKYMLVATQACVAGTSS